MDSPAGARRLQAQKPLRGLNPILAGGVRVSLSSEGPVGVAGLETLDDFSGDKPFRQSFQPGRVGGLNRENYRIQGFETLGLHDFESRRLFQKDVLQAGQLLGIGHEDEGLNLSLLAGRFLRRFGRGGWGSCFECDTRRGLSRGRCGPAGLFPVSLFCFPHMGMMLSRDVFDDDATDDRPFPAGLYCEGIRSRGDIHGRDKDFPWSFVIFWENPASADVEYRSLCREGMISYDNLDRLSFCDALFGDAEVFSDAGR